MTEERRTVGFMRHPFPGRWLGSLTNSDDVYSRYVPHEVLIHFYYSSIIPCTLLVCF